MPIYDCFMFFNELDVLEIRLHELYDVVDYFVIVESHTSHRGHPKPFVFQANWQRFARFRDKIRYIPIWDLPLQGVHPGSSDYYAYCERRGIKLDDPWSCENYQRYCLGRGLWDLDPESWVMVSDCDEIPRASEVAQLKHLDHSGPVIFQMPVFYFKLNYVCANVRWLGPVAVRGKDFQDAHTSRDLVLHGKFPPDGARVLHGGWHWSYLGDRDHVAIKIGNFAHSEHDHEEVYSRLDLDTLIANNQTMYDHAQCVPVQIDDYWPSIVRDNLAKWHHLVVQGDNLPKINQVWQP